MASAAQRQSGATPRPWRAFRRRGERGSVRRQSSILTVPEPPLRCSRLAHQAQPREHDLLGSRRWPFACPEAHGGNAGRTAALASVARMGVAHVACISEETFRDGCWLHCLRQAIVAVHCYPLQPARWGVRSAQHAYLWLAVSYLPCRLGCLAVFRCTAGRGCE